MSARKRNIASRDEVRELTPPNNSISNRRKLTAILSSPPGITTPSKTDGNTNTNLNENEITPTINRQRKSKRKKMYELEMTKLNRSFAEWSHYTEILLTDYYRARSDTSPTSSTPPHKPNDFCLLPAVRKYLRAAEAITLKFRPPTFQLLTFGSGDCGQLALSEDVMESRTPKMVKSIDKRVKSVACGGLHTVVALEQTGRVEVWGCNDHGSLGDCGTLGTAWWPIPMRGFIPSRQEVAKHHLLQDANKYWDDMSSLEQEALTDPRKARSLPIDWEECITAVAAGDCQTLTLSTTGRVYMCGCYKDKEGKMWRDQMPPDDPRVLHPIQKHRDLQPPEGSQDWPIHVYQMPGKVEAISCGAGFNAAIVLMKRTGNDGQATGLQRSCVTWGLGECGELARPVFQPLKRPDPDFGFHLDKARDEYLIPQPVIWADQAMTKNHIVHNISCGAYHLIVVAKSSEDGSLNVYGSGLNNYGQLGMGDIKPRHELTRVNAFNNSSISNVATGVHHTLCLDSSGRHLYGMGRGDSGQLGITEKIPETGFCKDLPVPINLSEGGKDTIITQISCGGNHCLALLDNGDAYTWGYGELNALGHGVEQDEYTPRKFDPLIGINRKRAKDGMMPLKAKIEIIDGGGQHSAVTICSSIA